MTLDSFERGIHGEMGCTCRDFQQKCVKLNSAAAVTLVDAVTGKRLHIRRIAISGDATMVYSVLSGANPLFDFYGMEYFGASLQSDSGACWFICNQGENFELTVSATVNAAIYLQWGTGD